MGSGWGVFVHPNSGTLVLASCVQLFQSQIAPAGFSAGTTPRLLSLGKLHRALQSQIAPTRVVFSAKGHTQLAFLSCPAPSGTALGLPLLEWRSVPGATPSFHLGQLCRASLILDCPCRTGGVAAVKIAWNANIWGPLLSTHHITLLVAISPLFCSLAQVENHLCGIHIIFTVFSGLPQLLRNYG